MVVRSAALWRSERPSIGCENDQSLLCKCTFPSNMVASNGSCLTHITKLRIGSNRKAPTFDATCKSTRLRSPIVEVRTSQLWTVGDAVDLELACSDTYDLLQVCCPEG